MAGEGGETPKITWKFVILFYFNFLGSETTSRGFVNAFSNTPLKLSYLVLATNALVPLEQNICTRYSEHWSFTPPYIAEKLCVGNLEITDDTIPATYIKISWLLYRLGLLCKSCKYISIKLEFDLKIKIFHPRNWIFSIYYNFLKDSS